MKNFFILDSIHLVGFDRPGLVGSVLFAGPTIFLNSCAIQVKVKTSELLAAVKIARVYSREGSNVVQLHVSDSIVVHAKSEELGESWTVVTPEHLNRVKVHDIVIGFNADFLIDYLKTAGESVTIDLWKPTSPAVFFDGAGTDYTALLMPFHVGTPDCITPADIPNPHGRPDKITAEFDLVTGEFIRDPRDVAYTESADAWKAAHTVKHDPEFGTHYAGGVIPDDIYTPAPEPGAVTLDIGTVFSYYVDPPTYGRDPKDKKIVFHLVNPQPDPDAPIPADGWLLPNRQPLFDGDTLTIGECSRCTDPNPHALIDGLCNSCRLEIAELESAARR